MIESSISCSQCFPSSPSLLLSQMNDPGAMLTSLCSPFLEVEEICSPDLFCLSFVTDVLAPNVRRALLQYDEAHSDTFKNLPKLVKVIVDNLEIEGLNTVESEILDSIVSLYLAVSQKPQHELIAKVVDLYSEALSSIPSRYRDDVLVDTIIKNSTSSDSRLRILAAHIISLVRKNDRVIAQFKSLAQDRQPSVRVTIINSLPNCNFDGPIIEYILTNGAHDNSPFVRKAVAAIFGFITPQLTDEYIQLLTNESTTESALKCFQAMANYSGFAAFFDSILLIIGSFPDECADILIQYAPFVDPSEHRLLYKCAKKLKPCITFINNFFEFTRVFANKERFFKFFNVEKMSNTEEKVAYAKQCVSFVDDFGADIITVAVSFANDANEDVRNASVGIFIELVKKDAKSIEYIKQLMNGGWHQRLILAKVIVAIGILDDFLEVAKLLANDAVADIRYCLEEGTKNTKSCSKHLCNGKK